MKNVSTDSADNAGNSSAAIGIAGQTGAYIFDHFSSGDILYIDDTTHTADRSDWTLALTAGGNTPVYLSGQSQNGEGAQYSFNFRQFADATASDAFISANHAVLIA